MTNDELKDARNRRGLTQEQMAKLLADTPISTYRKWEQGINDVPPYVDQLLFPKNMVIPGLTLAEIVELDEAAREKGTTMDELIGDFIRRGLKGTLLLLLCLLAWQIFAGPVARGRLEAAGDIAGRAYRAIAGFHDQFRLVE